MSIGVIDKFKPKNNGQFPIYEDVDGYGGYQVQPTTTTRDAIPTANRKAGMLVYVTGNATFYQLASDLATWNVVNLGGSTAMGGDVTGVLGANTVVNIRGVPVSSAAPVSGQIFQFNSPNWTPTTISGDISISSTGVVEVVQSSAPLFKTIAMQNDGYVNVTDNGSPVSTFLPLYGTNVTCTYVSSLNHQAPVNIPVGTYDSALRIDMGSTSGGAWDVDQTITGSACQMLTHVAGNQGTHELIIGNIAGLGIGDCLPFSMVVDSWGGSTTLDDGPSVSESANVGEFDLAEGGVRYSDFNGGPVPVESLVAGGCIFTATVSGSPATSATTINFTSPTNQDIMGCRFVLNLNHKKTNGVCTSIVPNQDIQETVFTFSVSDFTNADVGRYIKIGSSNENYTVTEMSQLQGDDVFLNGKGVGHWFPIKSVTVNSITTYGVWDIVDYPSYATLPNASYMVVDGSVIQSFTTSSMVIQTNNYSWANGDVLYSPPNHYQGLIGLNLISQKLFRTGTYSINASDGVKITSRGLQPLEYGLHLEGVGLDGYGGFNTCLQFNDFNSQYGINMQAINCSIAGIAMNQNTPIIMDSSQSHPSIVGDSLNGIIIQGRQGNVSVFATDGAFSDFVVSHPSVGQVNITDSSADIWLIQKQGDLVHLGPGAGDGYQSLTVDTSKVRLQKGTQFGVTPIDGYYQVLQTDYYIAVQALSEAITITLPSSLNATPGDTYVIKDAHGSAATFNISIAGNGIQIDGSGSHYVMSTNYQCLRVAYDNNSNNWMIV